MKCSFYISFLLFQLFYTLISFCCQIQTVKLTPILFSTEHGKTLMQIAEKTKAAIHLHGESQTVFDFLCAPVSYTSQVISFQGTELSILSQDHLYQILKNLRFLKGICWRRAAKWPFGCNKTECLIKHQLMWISQSGGNVSKYSKIELPHTYLLCQEVGTLQ